MADLGETFDGDTIDTSAADLIPNGKVLAQAIEAEVKDTKAGTGKILNVTFEVAEGPHEKRRVWASFNFRNASEKAEGIGRRDLAKFTKAISLGPFSDAEHLLFKPVIIDIGVQKGEGTYPDRNCVRGYHAYAEHSPPARTTTARPAAPAAATGGRAPTFAGRPWPGRQAATN
jgi:hypothetical protein